MKQPLRTKAPPAESVVPAAGTAAGVRADVAPLDLFINRLVGRGLDLLQAHVARLDVYRHVVQRVENRLHRWTDDIQLLGHRPGRGVVPGRLHGDDVTRVHGEMQPTSRSPNSTR